MTDCENDGHYWVEENGELFARHNKRRGHKVPVMCCVCGTTAELEGYAANTRAYQLPPT